MSEEEARDILANCINDYVIAEYCSSCDNKESCKDDDCIFSKAIELVLNHITKQEKMIELMAYEIDRLDDGSVTYSGHENFIENIKQYFEKKVEVSK